MDIEIFYLPDTFQVTSNDIKPWTDVGMKFLAWNDDIANLTLTLRGMMNCQEQMTSSSLSTQPIQQQVQQIQ